MVIQDTSLFLETNNIMVLNIIRTQVLNTAGVQLR